MAVLRKTRTVWREICIWWTRWICLNLTNLASSWPGYLRFKGSLESSRCSKWTSTNLTIGLKRILGELRIYSSLNFLINWRMWLNPRSPRRLNSSKFRTWRNYRQGWSEEKTLILSRCVANKRPSSSQGNHQHLKGLKENPSKWAGSKSKLIAAAAATKGALYFDLIEFVMTSNNIYLLIYFARLNLEIIFCR